MDNEQITKNRHMYIPVEKLQQSRHASNDVFEEGMMEDGVVDTMSQTNSVQQATQWPWNLPVPSATPSNQQQGIAIRPPSLHDLPIPSNWSPVPAMIALSTRRQISPGASNFSPVIASPTMRQPSHVTTFRRWSLHLHADNSIQPTRVVHILYRTLHSAF